MTTIYLLIGLLHFITAVNSANDDKVDLQLIVSGNGDVTGTVWFHVCSNEEEFESERNGIIHSAEMKGGMLHTTLRNIRPGFYAIKLYVDRNHNQLLDMSLLGVPKEPYGFSNNVMGIIGPPSFNDAGFHVFSNRNNTVSIKLRGD